MNAEARFAKWWMDNFAVNPDSKIGIANDIARYWARRAWTAATEAANQHLEICEVCFTSSWQPCEESFEDAVKDPQGAGWMVCGYCLLKKSLRDATETEHAKSIARIAELEESLDGIRRACRFANEATGIKSPDVIHTISFMREHIMELEKELVECMGRNIKANGLEKST